MASLQDILSQNQPDELRKLLDSSKKEEDIKQLGQVSPPIMNVEDQPNQNYKKYMDDSGASSDENKEDNESDKDDLDQHYQEGQNPSDEQKKNLQMLLSGKFDKSKLNASNAVPSSPQENLPESSNTVENLRQAQEAANKQVGQANLMKALDTLNSGLIGTSLKTTPPTTNPEFYNKISEQANQKVQQFKDLGEQEKNDPDSRGSKLASGFASQLLSRAGFDPNMVKGMSYNEIEKNFPQLAKMMDAKEASDTRKELFQLKLKEMGLKAEESKAQKASQTQDRSLDQATKLLESARGNPAAAQAERDLYSAQKADSLASMYGDANKLSPQLVKLLASEVAKIAQGGAPTMEELKGLTPNTLNSKLASITQQLTNNPTPANAAKFIKQYQDYTSSLKKDAQKVIKDKYGRIIESRKDQLGEDNYNSLKNTYLNRFENEEQNAKEQSNSQAQEVITAPNGKKYLVDHNTKQVLKEVE